jgi:hypothetical protein
MGDVLAWLEGELLSFKESDKRRERLVLVSFLRFANSTSPPLGAFALTFTAINIRSTLTIFEKMAIL